MPTGILGQSNPAANTDTTVYTVPSSVAATFNVNVVNQSGTPVSVNLALAAGATPAASEYIEFQTILPGNGVLERGGLVAQTGKRVVVNCSNASCSVAVYGFEQ